MTNTAKKVEVIKTEKVEKGSVVTAEMVKAHSENIRKYWNNTKDGILNTCKELFLVKKEYGVEGLKELEVPLARQNRQKMVKIGEHKLINLKKNKEFLPASWGTLYELSRLNDIAFTKAIKEGVIKEDMTRADANKLYKAQEELAGNVKVDQSKEDFKKSIEGKEKLFVIYAKDAKSVYEEMNEFLLKERADVFVHDVFSETQEKLNQKRNKSAKDKATKICRDVLSKTVVNQLLEEMVNQNGRWKESHPELAEFLKEYTLDALRRLDNPGEVIDPVLSQYRDWTYADKFEVAFKEVIANEGKKKKSKKAKS